MHTLRVTSQYSGRRELSHVASVSATAVGHSSDTDSPQGLRVRSALGIGVIGGRVAVLTHAE
eukprot:COSAG06_NODE_22601_length_718_cov_1.090468_1_plen_61_part_10